MSMTDPIADMLTRIRNGLMAELPAVDIPQSKMKLELARILKREGYILDHTSEAEDHRKVLKLFLKYGVDNESVIQGLRRVSKPSLRRYANAKKIPRVLGGLGIAIISTSQGIVTDREARRNRVGGEVLCYVW
jgi:small subunit ribosomal protein S8